MLEADIKPVETFNDLIGINNNRIECYSFASNRSGSHVLRSLFERLVETSLSLKQELVTEVFKLGGVPREGTLGTSPFFKAWMRVHAALLQENNRQVIGSCHDAECLVRVACSRITLSGWEFLNSFQKDMLSSHLDLIRADFSQVSNVCGLFAPAAPAY